MEITTGIMGAMPQEIEGVIQLLQNRKAELIGHRTYYSGDIEGNKVVVVFSRWGKVAAASTVLTLIHHFGIRELIFTGVAGAIHPALNIGDVVIARDLIQHDFDARPFLDRYEIPLLGMKSIRSHAALSSLAEAAVSTLLESNRIKQEIGEMELKSFNISNALLHVGEIASGDQFFSHESQKQNLREELPDVLCVEMEGAAVAQACHDHDVPFCVIRTISDSADHNSAIDFQAFINKVASKYSTAIIAEIFRRK